FIRNMRLGLPSARLKVYRDADARRVMAAHFRDGWTHRTVMVGWDNTPRRGRNGVVITGTTPAALRTALEEAIADTELRHDGPERILWLNAWNEWAEGNYLEPDRAFGHGFLETVRDANTPRNVR